MKPKIIKYGKSGEHELRVDREFFSFLLGIILIFSCALMSGILQLIEVGFNFSLIKSADFWTAYLIKLAVGYLCLFGCYVIKKGINKKTEKFLIQRNDIVRYRKIIVKENKVSDLKDWLKNVYNYRKKVELYQELLLSMNEKIDTEKPIEVDEKDYASGNKFVSFFLKIRLWFAKKIYKKRKKDFDKNTLIKKYISDQLNVCATHFKIIEAYKKGNDGEVKQLILSIKDTDHLNDYKIKFKKVTYSGLFNFDVVNSNSDDFIDYDEKKFILKNTLPFLMLSLVAFCLLASIVPELRAFTIDTLILIFLNLLVIGWNAFSGTMLANRFTWGVVYNADANRLSILNEFKEDHKLNIDVKKEGE